MKITGRKKLADFKSKHTDAHSSIDSWEAEVAIAEWKTPHDIKQRYPRASILGKKQVVFDIKGNQFRIYTIVDYQYQIVIIKEVGTHEEYMKWKFL